MAYRFVRRAFSNNNDIGGLLDCGKSVANKKQNNNNNVQRQT